MSDIQIVSVKQIDEKIITARSSIAALEKKAQGLSLPVVSGDPDAARSLEATNALIEQAEGDLRVLEQARKAAEKLEIVESDVVAAANRARHLRIAKDHAGGIVQLASRADELIGEITEMFAALDETEREIWFALGKANLQPVDAIVGRRNLKQFVVDHILDLLSGRDKFKRGRPVAVIAAVAWNHLLGGENDAGV